ncbi:MAG: YfhO family protein, partial [Acidobacteria bacterium]|nr:YfhO family protein [Acidobacteriota bacterium]
PTLIVCLLGNGSALVNAYFLLLILCSGVFTYFFLRPRVEHWAAALAGGIGFALSGTVIQTVPYVVGHPIALFSLPLIVTARLIDQPNARRAAQLALVFAFVATATFPPALLMTFGSCVIYTAFATRDRRTWGWFAAGAAISLMLVAFLYIPAKLVMDEASHISEYYKHGAELKMDPHRLLQILSPTIMGGVDVYRNPAIGPPTGHQFYYVGIAVLLLAGIGSLARPAQKARALQLTAILCSILGTMKAVGLPPLQWIQYVPFLRNFHYAAYAGIAVAWCAVMLAALGVDALLAGRAKRWQIAISAISLAGVLAAMRLGAYLVHAERIPNYFRWEHDLHLLALFLVLAATFAWFAGRRPAVALLIAVVAAEGMTYAMWPRPRRWDLWNHPPQYVEIMRRRNTGNRVLPLPIFPANTESVYGIPTLDVILTASTRVFEVYRDYFGPIDSPLLRDSRRIPPERVLDAANVEYLTIWVGQPQLLAEAKARGYETLYNDAYVQLMRRNTEPRYWFTSRYEVVPNALPLLPQRPAGEVFLDRTPSFASSDGAPAAPKLTKFGLNELELTIDAPRAGLLVCSESNMNGWRATIDGRPTPILAANYAFRAVEVPTGRHIIRLAYRPPGFRLGLFIALLGAVLCAVLLRASSSQVATSHRETA